MSQANPSPENDALIGGVRGRPPGELTLLLSAEKLFAEEGIAAPSLRQIVAAAGQKNSSAAHYHFGSREGLLRELLTYRMTEINHRRVNLLSRDPHHASSHDLRFYIEAFVLPLAEELNSRIEGNYCLRFLEQYWRFAIDEELVRSLEPSAYEMADQIRRLISYLPRPVVNMRLGMIWSAVVPPLANVELGISRGDVARGDLGLIVTNLVDMVTAAISAPLSPPSLENLEKAGQT